VNTPRCDEDRLELMELTVFLLPSDEKVGIEVSAIALQVSAVKLILLLLVQKFLLFGLTNWCCSLNAVRLQNKKKVVITEATLRDSLRLDDAEGIECLPNEEIFAELARMGYEKPSTKLTFYKAFFSSQGRKFNFSKYIFDSLVRNVDSPTKFYMYLRFLQLMIRKQVGKGFSRVETLLFKGMIVEHQVDEGNAKMNVEDVSTTGVAAEGDVSAADDVVPTAVEEPSIPSPTPPVLPPQSSQDQPSTSQVQLTPPQAQPQSPQHQPQPSQDVGFSMNLLQNLMDTCTTLTRRVEHLEQDKIAQALEITKLKQRERMITDMDADVDVILEDAKEVDVEKSTDVDESVDIQGRKLESQAQIYQINLEHANKVLSIQDDKVEPAELQEVAEVVTTAKLITEVVTAASATITAAAPKLTTAAAPTLTTAPSVARRRNGVLIRDLEESATPSTIVHSEAKSKDKGILVEEPKPLKKQAQIEQDEAYARELEVKLNKNIEWDEVIDHVQRKQKEDNAVKRYQALKRKPQTKAQARKNMMIYLRNTKEQMVEEDSRALKRLSETQEEKAAKKQKLDEEQKRHLQIVLNDEDDVYTEATPLARKVPVVDYEIYTENNKPYYKIKRANGSHQLYLSFLNMLRNFDREDLEVLWQLVKERFTSTKPKNFFDDFLLTTLGTMLEKPAIQA
nr:hypothetical protein [Tanacetum cinerariifolium]